MLGWFRPRGARAFGKLPKVPPKEEIRLIICETAATKGSPSKEKERIWGYQFSSIWIIFGPAIYPPVLFRTHKKCSKSRLRLIYGWADPVCLF